MFVPLSLYIGAITLLLISIINDLRVSNAIANDSHYPWHPSGLAAIASH